MALDAIILAGGRGTRLASVVSDVPKPFAPIAGRAFLDYLIDRLAASGVVDRLIVTLGHLADRAVAHFAANPPRLPVEILVEPDALGTGGAVTNALAAVTGDRFLVLNGDTMLALDYAALLDAHDATDARGMLSLVEVADASRFGSVLRSGAHITAFAEKRSGAGWINGGVYVFQREAFANIAAGPASLERDLLPEMAEHGWLAGYESRAPFIDIGLPETYAAAEAFLAAL
jgi:NDP-sugar pyrophosphorylase family protein